MSDILLEVKKVILSSTGSSIPLGQLDQDYSLLGNILDSMAVTNLILALEEHFGFHFNDDELTAEAFETVGALAFLVKKKVGE
jgi:acyl carrier protein